MASTTDRRPEGSRSAASKDAGRLSSLRVAQPPALAELDAVLAALGGFESCPFVAVATSGGPDSLALAILADRWARVRGGEAWGLIVDHRLRPESETEAETVAGWLAMRDIPHAVLVWHGDKPVTGIQEAARAARYRLLTEWCVAKGCLHLLTAHHRDDQAETYLIRRRAGSGVDGLAGMSAVRELRGLRLARPLLTIPKARLVAFLKAERQPYVSDPSNRNPVFERARLRLAAERSAASHPTPLPACGERERDKEDRSPRQCGEREGPAAKPWEGEGQGSLDAEIRGNAIDRIAREQALAALLARSVALHPAGFAVLDPTPIAAAGELGERALDRLVAVVGGVHYPRRRERLARLHEALGETPFRARTLGSCRFVAWRGRVLVLREAARVAPPLRLEPGGAAPWDDRFFATLPVTAASPVSIGALGIAGAAELDRVSIADDNPLPRLLYPALPAFRDDAGLAAVPHLGWRRTTPGCAASLAFRPPVSLLGAGFTVV